MYESMYVCSFLVSLQSCWWTLVQTLRIEVAVLGHSGSMACDDAALPPLLFFLYHTRVAIFRLCLDISVAGGNTLSPCWLLLPGTAIVWLLERQCRSLPEKQTCFHSHMYNTSRILSYVTKYDRQFIRNHANHANACRMFPGTFDPQNWSSRIQPRRKALGGGA